MKKTILSILAGATMLASAANAAPSMKIDATDLVIPTGDQVISDLYNQNTGGINNVSLSKYEQAWMIVHEKDTMFKHKTFWVRTGKVFTGIAIDDIKDLSKSDRTEVIMDSVKKSVVEAALRDQAEKLSELYKEEINKLQIQFTKERVNAVAKVQAELDNVNKTLSALQDANAKLTITAVNNAVTEAQNDSRYIDDNTKLTDAQIDRKIEDATINLQGIYNQYAHTISINVHLPGQQKTVRHIEADINSSGIAGQLASHTYVTNLGFDYHFDLQDLAQAFADGFKEGYADGFNDGYDQGYQDGYSDGFRDGVNSVK